MNSTIIPFSFFANNPNLIYYSNIIFALVIMGLGMIGLIFIVEHYRNKRGLIFLCIISMELILCYVVTSIVINILKLNILK